MSSNQVEKTLAKLAPLIRQLDPKHVITQSDSSYTLHSETYSVHKDLRPAVVFAPDTAKTLATIVRFLYKTDLDFAVRGRGYKSPSAHDAIISMLNFNTFEYDSSVKLATVGVGLNWAQVAAFMEREDPEYCVAAARTPAVGVGGAILSGGFSWLSTEFGCISDPINFVDAEVVKYDGSIVMASQEPDLLWALRGGGGGVGIMTKAVLRAHHYPTKIWSGLVLVERKWLPELMQDIDAFVSSTPHPRINFFVYFVPKKLLPNVLEEPEPDAGDVVVLHVYDALGESHGRAAFKWALEKPGTIDKTRVTNMSGILAMQKNADALRGTQNVIYYPMALADLPKETVARTIEWYESIEDPEIRDNSFVALEYFIARQPLTGTDSVAWPRPRDFKHLLLVAGGAPATGPPSQLQALRDLIISAPRRILGSEARAAEAKSNPAGLEDFHDRRVVYGGHYEKLVSLIKKYDPEGRFKNELLV